MNKILVAGMDTEVNPFTKLVLDYGFKPAHVGRDSNKELPNCDAAIVAISNCGHVLAEKVKKEYKEQGKPIFFSKTSGTSGVIAEFESVLVDPIRQKLEYMTWGGKLSYLLCLYYKPNSKFIFKIFLQQIRNYLPDCSPVNLSNFLKKSSDNGVVERIAGAKGRYIFLGIDEGLAVDLKSAGINVKLEWYKPSIEKELTPEVEPDLKPSEIERIQKEIQEKSFSNSEEMGILLDMVKNLSESVESIRSSTTVKMTELNKKLASLQTSVDPRGSDVIIDEITADLRRMSMSDLRRFQSMMLFWNKN